MSKLPVVDVKTFEKLLLKLGFRIIRQKGSHLFYKHQDGRYTTLPHYANTDSSRPLARQILQQISVTPEEFPEYLARL